jgi:hypothetical protein
MSNKKILVLVLVFINAILYSQDSVLVQKKIELYVGVSPTLYNKLNINDYLTKNNLSKINTFTYPFLIGFNFNFNKIQFTYEGSYSSNFVNKNGESKTTFNSLSNRIGLSHTIVNNKDFKLYFGVNYSFTTYSSFVYFKSNDLDLNTIDSSSTKGIMKIINFSHNLGGAFSFVFNDNSNSSKHTIIRVGYDIAITQNKWYSEYSNIKNSPIEKFDRLYISVSRPIISK